MAQDAGYGGRKKWRRTKRKENMEMEIKDVQCSAKGIQERKRSWKLVDEDDNDQ